MTEVNANDPQGADIYCSTHAEVPLKAFEVVCSGSGIYALLHCNTHLSSQARSKSLLAASSRPMWSISSITGIEVLGVGKQIDLVAYGFKSCCTVLQQE